MEDIKLVVSSKFDENNCFELNTMRSICFDLSNQFELKRGINGSILYLPISTTIDD